VLQPRVIKADLKGMWFATSKCFLLPTARHGLQCITSLYGANPETDMLIVGHADRAGTPAYNDPLSLERAEAMAAYLTDDVDAWMVWYGQGKAQEKRWGDDEDEMMAAALAEDAGESVGDDETPVGWFQRSRGMTVAAKANTATRRALVLAYMQVEGTTLPEGIEPVTHGCGENFPIKPTADGVAELENRRVEIFFFENVVRAPERPSAVLPAPPGKNSPPGSKQYPEWMTRVRELHEFEAGAWIRLLMKYDDGSLASSVRFRIKYDDDTAIEASTSDAGILMAHVSKEQGWSITGIEDESIVTSFA
jgi:outer membrane protein OmpA-like peptidoglycan-associated protein